MHELEETLAQLAARLPELEWKISHSGIVIDEEAVPQGLFRLTQELNARACIQEIKVDLQQLKKKSQSKILEFLAKRIRQKIDFLVHVYHIQALGKRGPEEKTQAMDAITTRQQWLTNLNQEITALNEQREALSLRLSKLKKRGDSQSILSLQAEIGQLERQLTLARETWVRATAL